MELSKDQIVNKCKAAGLNVKIEDGIVKLIFDTDKKDQQIETFLNKLEDLGYKGSWGYRGKSNSDKNAFTDTGSTIVEE